MPNTGSAPYEVPEAIVEKWQKAVDVLAVLVGVPAALVMRINGPDIEVFRASRTQGNPYSVGDSEHLVGSGLYCETVINSRDKLLVPDAAADPDWKNNPDVKLNMISYLGFPIIRPDNQVFGTLCILDDHNNSYGEDVENLMLEFKDMLETHLDLLEKNNHLNRSLSEIRRLSAELSEMARTDPLTGLLNRRSFDSIFQTEQSRASRSGSQLCLAMCDIDGFKKINDTLGHLAGDRILKCVADAFLERKRGQDYIFRWGGDEFLLLMPETSPGGAETFVSGVMELLADTPCREDGRNVPDTEMSFGITLQMQDESVEDAIRRCDLLLYKAKTQKGSYIEKG